MIENLDSAWSSLSSPKLMFMKKKRKKEKKKKKENSKKKKGGVLNRKNWSKLGINPIFPTI